MKTSGWIEVITGNKKLCCDELSIRLKRADVLNRVLVFELINYPSIFANRMKVNEILRQASAYDVVSFKNIQSVCNVATARRLLKELAGNGKRVIVTSTEPGSELIVMLTANAEEVVYV